MKAMTPEELRIRLRRTVTNKFSTTIEPYGRRALRDRAFEDKDFCTAIDKAADVLQRIAKSIEADKDKLKKARLEERRLAREKRLAKKEKING